MGIQDTAGYLEGVWVVRVLLVVWVLLCIWGASVK